LNETEIESDIATFALLPQHTTMHFTGC